MKETGKIIIVGDFFPVPSNFSKFRDGDISYLMGDSICKLFAEADYRICNLEGTLTDDDGICEKTGPVVKAPTAAIEAYKKIGIDCCCLANNHITDAGHQGVLDTMRVLNEAQINHIGAGENEKTILHFISFELCGKTFGLYNVCETMYNSPLKAKAGAWLYDEYVVCKEITEYRKQCDYLIVIYHGGIEKFRYPSPETRKRFHRMADSGADMILSQHTHCIGCEENYGGAYLLYGQGDFLFNNFRPGLTDTGLIVELVIRNGSIDVIKHKVRADDYKVLYDEEQILDDFKERSALLRNEKYVKKQFEDFCFKELYSYLYAFKSPSVFYRLMRRIFPSFSKNWLYYNSYRRRELMFTLHTLRSEQNRETAIWGIEALLKNKCFSK